MGRTATRKATIGATRATSKTTTRKTTVRKAAAADAARVVAAAEPLKILAGGHAVPASDPRTDHVAVLFPDGWMIAANVTSNDGQHFATHAKAIEAVAKTRLLGHRDWINAPLDDVLLRHVIRHDRYNPAVDTNLFPNFPQTGWIWSDVTPWSESAAFCVILGGGGVSDDVRVDSGFGLACRRARQ